jgi:hypothetical protein
MTLGRLVDLWSLIHYAAMPQDGEDGRKGWIEYSFWIDSSLLGCYTALCGKYFLTFQMVELHLHGKELQAEFSLTLRMRAPESFETSEITYQEKWRHIPDDFHIQKYRCDSAEYWIVFVTELILRATIRILRTDLWNALPKSGLCVMNRLELTDLAADSFASEHFWHVSLYTGMCRITTFRSKMDRIYDGGHIR